MAYKYIRIVHEGEDYITVKVGSEEHEITGASVGIIKTLLNKIKKDEKQND